VRIARLAGLRGRQRGLRRRAQGVAGVQARVPSPQDGTSSAGRRPQRRRRRTAGAACLRPPTPAPPPEAARAAWRARAARAGQGAGFTGDAEDGAARRAARARRAGDAAADYVDELDFAPRLREHAAPRLALPAACLALNAGVDTFLRVGGAGPLCNPNRYATGGTIVERVAGKSARTSPIPLLVRQECASSPAITTSHWCLCALFGGVSRGRATSSMWSAGGGEG
jgi:hypothetical protein